MKLGCLNHAQLTRLGIESHGVSFAGWIANGIDPDMARAPENLLALERLLGEPALAVVPHGSVASLSLPQAVTRLAQRTHSAAV